MPARMPLQGRREVTVNGFSTILKKAGWIRQEVGEEDEKAWHSWCHWGDELWFSQGDEPVVARADGLDKGILMVMSSGWIEPALTVYLHRDGEGWRLALVPSARGNFWSGDVWSLQKAVALFMGDLAAAEAVSPLYFGKGWRPENFRKPQRQAYRAGLTPKPYRTARALATATGQAWPTTTPEEIAHPIATATLVAFVTTEAEQAYQAGSLDQAGRDARVSAAQRELQSVWTPGAAPGHGYSDQHSLVGTADGIGWMVHPNGAVWMWARAAGLWVGIGADRAVTARFIPGPDPVLEEAAAPLLPLLRALGLAEAAEAAFTSARHEAEVERAAFRAALRTA